MPVQKRMWSSKLMPAHTDWTLIGDGFIMRLEKGVMLSINPDAHKMEGYQDMYYGLLAGRKGGLTKDPLPQCHVTWKRFQNTFAVIKSLSHYIMGSSNQKHMKTLYLVRHAKSSWKDLSLQDRDRPLNKRGKRDAPVMAQAYCR